MREATGGPKGRRRTFWERTNLKLAVAGRKKGGPHPQKDGLLCSKGSAKERRECRQEPFLRTAGLGHANVVALGNGKQQRSWGEKSRGWKKSVSCLKSDQWFKKTNKRKANPIQHPPGQAVSQVVDKNHTVRCPIASKHFKSKRLGVSWKKLRSYS